MAIDVTKLAAELRTSPFAAARTIASESAGAPVLEQRIQLQFPYQSPIAASVNGILAGPIASGSPLAIDDFSGGDWFGFEPIVPQLIVGTDPDDVLSGIETGPLPAPVQITMTGTRLGASQSVTLSINEKGAYSFGRAFDALTECTSDLSVGATVHIATGKGAGLCNAIDAEGTVRASINGQSIDPATLHRPSGTVIPDGAYNPGENTLVVRYTPAVSS